MTAAARPWTAAPHVISLQIDGVAEILTGQRDDVLLAAIGSSWAFRSPIEASADLLPPALIAAIVALAAKARERYGDHRARVPKPSSHDNTAG